jgi:DNA-binding transcriptional LysR family regulator
MNRVRWGTLCEPAHPYGRGYAPGMDTRISVYKLEVLCKVVELQSVSRAASVLGVAQPVVSGHIRSLEKRLGLPLFARSGRGLVLTPGGELVHQWAAEVVACTHQAAARLDAFVGEQRERLTVVVSTGEHPEITELVVRFKATHPTASVNLRAMPAEQAIEAVRDKASDFALVLYSEGVDIDPALRVERLRVDEVVLVAGVSASVDDGPIVFDALAQLPFVCTPSGSARRRFIDAQLAQRGVERRQIVIEIGPEAPLHAAVRDGLGLALLSRRSVTAALEAGALREIPVRGGLFPVGLDLVSRKEADVSPTRRDFVQAARTTFTA